MSQQAKIWDAEPLTQGVFELMDVIERIEERKSSCKLVSVNVNNLLLHASDIESDCVIKMVDFVAFSETREQTDLQVNGFFCVSKAQRANTDTAGVAIYQSNKATSAAIPHSIRKVCESHDVELGLADANGDICAAQISVANKQVLLLCVYISPETSMKQKKFFLTRNLFMYFHETMPMVVTGNFSIDLLKESNLEFIDFMKKYMRLDFTADSKDTTTLTFTRDIELESRCYKSCLSHRPVLAMFE